MIFWSLNRWGQGQGEDLLLPLCQLNGCLDGESQQTRNFGKNEPPMECCEKRCLPRGITCPTLCFSSSAALICARSTWNTSQPKHDKVTWSNSQNTFSWRSLYFNAYWPPPQCELQSPFLAPSMAGNVCQSKSGTLRIHQRRKRHGSQPKTSLGFHRVSHSSMLICSCCFRFSRLYLAI